MMFHPRTKQSPSQHGVVQTSMVKGTGAVRASQSYHFSLEGVIQNTHAPS
jgi:hypothetical protein